MRKENIELTIIKLNMLRAYFRHKIMTILQYIDLPNSFSSNIFGSSLGAQGQKYYRRRILL